MSAARDAGVPTDPKPGSRRARNTEVQQVIVRDDGTEIHGYALALDEAQARVTWETAAGHRHTRVFPAEKVFLPSAAAPWAGTRIRWDERRP